VPEIPDLEAIRRNLIPKVVGFPIIEAQTLRSKRVYPSSEAWLAGLEGKRVSSLSRRGKFTLFHLEDDGALIAHMMLHGEMDWVPSAEATEKATIALLRFPSGNDLRFLDRSGWMRLTYVSPGQLSSVPELNELGPDPFDAPGTPDYLRQILSRFPGTAKYALMDQKLVSGVGNAFSDEILFCARILPTRKANDLNEQETDLLSRCIPETLRWAIEESCRGMGESIRGEIRTYLRVHGKEGKPCPRCQGTVRRIVLEGRGSYFCPGCQK
jgi:formamidopyrimidine-DNA glycosylase